MISCYRRLGRPEFSRKRIIIFCDSESVSYQPSLSGS